MSHRLPERQGEWIDRSRTLRFTLEGRSYTAHPGDTITSALMANGVTLLGRSFKYHRPRGALSLANHDVNTLFATGDDIHIRGDVTPVTDGMALQPVNVRGRLGRDADRHMDRLGRFLPVGFYYKAFYRPRWLFPFWERLIRRKAGLGTVDTGWQKRTVAKRYGFCDVLVVGAGPAGLRAALKAAGHGLDVLLADEAHRPGGSLNYQWRGDSEATRLKGELLAAVGANTRVRTLMRATALGYYADHWVPLSTPEGILKVRARRGVILATGLMEQPAVFRNNDLPGIMLASGAQRLMHQYAVAPCRRAVVLAANAEGCHFALDLLEAGISVAALAIPHGDKTLAREVIDRLRDRGVTPHYNTTIFEAHGRKQVTAVTLGHVDGQDHCEPLQGGKITCDGVFMSAGWAPAGHLLYQAGGSFGYDPYLQQWVPNSLARGVIPAGRVNGAFSLAQQIADADAAVQRLLAHQGEGTAEATPVTAHRDSQAHSHPWPIVAHPRGRNFIDFDEDLQLKDLEQAAAEGFDNIELLKRFSTVGMGPSQGKHANMNAIRVLARLRGQNIDETGTTTARPMYHPVPLEQLAGRAFRPQRRSPLHAQHAAHGAVFMEAGAWLRPAYYGDGGQDADASIRREILAVRDNAGLIDTSTLGKIEVLGPDAARLLETAYTGRLADMGPGQARHLVRTDESGVIQDDGVAGRIVRDHFYVTTSSGQADQTHRALGRLALEWGLQARAVNRTGQLAAITLAGPDSRRLLAPLTDAELDGDRFPLPAIRRARVAGHPAYLLRVAFVGELGYEIHLPVAGAGPVWEALTAAGARPFGVEAQRTLRLEKGHLIIGQDTDGLTHPFEVGLGRGVAFDKPFFVGRDALERLRTRPGRRLTGFALASDYAGPMPQPCHLVVQGQAISGRITSIAYSPALGRIVGLAMLDENHSGGHLSLRLSDGTRVAAEICPTPFYDSDNRRQKAVGSEVTA